MPALAVLLALGWQRIARWPFVTSLVATAVVLTLLGVLSLRLQQAMPGLQPHPAVDAFLLGAAGGVVLVGLLVPALTRSLALAAVFLAYLSFAHLSRPFDGPAGQYDPQAQARARGREVWVPYDFVAKEERYRFLLPGARVVGYREARRPAAPEPMPRGTLVAVQVPLRGEACAGCTVVGRRLDVRGRQTAAELRDILAGRISPALFVEELLVETPGTETGPSTPGGTASPR